MTEQNQPQNEGSMALANSDRTAFEIAQMSPPRDLTAIWQQVQAELQFSPETAEKTWYSIPYSDKQSGKKVAVEGIGVHGADVLKRAWGHCAVGGGIMDAQPDRVICRGITHDYKNNTKSYNEIIVNRYQTGKDGRPYRLVGKHWDNAVQSGISKARRNSFLSAIPEVLKERMFTLAKKLTLGGKKGAKPMTAKEKLAIARVEFTKKFKIKMQAYDDYLNGLALETDEDVLTHVKGLWNAFVTGEETVQNVFGLEPEGQAVMKQPQETKSDDNNPS